MNKQGLNEKIRNRIGRNLYYMSCVVTNNNVRTEFEKNNELLDAIFVEMRQDKSSEDYEKGLNDAWELAQKICCLPPIGYTCDELTGIFGPKHKLTTNIMKEHTYQQALAKVEEYEKKKAEEEARPVRGDIVKVTDKRDSSCNYGIYLGDDYYSYYILRRKSTGTSQYTKQFFTLEKTDQHVDLEGWNID